MQEKKKGKAAAGEKKSRNQEEGHDDHDDGDDEMGEDDAELAMALQTAMTRDDFVKKPRSFSF